MSMRWCIFRKSGWKNLAWLMILLGTGISVSGQNRHEIRVERYQRGWNRLIPHYQKIQYAGSMGLISLGCGWDYGKREQWETDFFLGYLPRFDGDKGHLTITIKENYIPWRFLIRKSRWAIEPFTVSLYMNKIFGDEFWTREPDKYPDGYYGLATNTRINLAFGQRFDFKIKPIGLSDRICLYYEFGTNDLYLISYLTNKYLHLSDIFSLSLGIKFKFL